MLAVLAARADAQPVAPPSAAARAAWGFSGSDLPPHPGVRFGVLPNGMRYALMRGSGGLSARMRVDVGSGAEGAREQGAMHLIEHLIFQESENLPRFALPLMLGKQGLKRPSDFEAFTSYDETVYRLDLPKADRDTRTTALSVVREIAGHLAFTRRAVDGAREAVVRELRTRDAAADRIETAQNAFFFPGTPIARGSVIGTKASVSHARGKALQRLYDRYYAPERSTLVLVGDFDPAVAEAEIVARFSDWRARAAPGPKPAPAPVRADRGLEARLFVDRAAPTAVTIAVAAPLGGPDARARRDNGFLEHLGFELLNARLARIGAAAAIYDHFSTGRLARIDVPASGHDWRGALAAGALELRRALEWGFTQGELDARLAATRRALDANAAPRTGPALGDAIIDAAGRGVLFTAPADATANAAYLARVRLADVDAAFRAAWGSRTRLIFVSHDRRVPDGEAAIAAAWSEAARAGVTPASPR